MKKTKEDELIARCDVMIKDIEARIVDRWGKSALKPYCTQNDGDCSTCSLKICGRDCRNREID